MRLNQIKLNQAHHQMQCIFFMANRKPINYFDLSTSLKKLWYKSETILRYLVYNFYGLKPNNLPSRFHNKINRLKIHHKADQRTNHIKTINNQIKSSNQFKNLNSRRWPYLDKLIGSHSHASVYISKWRRNLRSDLTNFALITLAVQNSTATEEEISWIKLKNLLRKMFDEENKSGLSDKLSKELFKLDNFDFNRYIGKGCNAAIYEANLKQSVLEQFKNRPFENETFENQPFAIKMLFNYDIESNAFAIMKAMNKECIPYEGSFGIEIDSLLGVNGSRKKLPAHPNIVKIYGLFVDQIPELPKAKELFKNALPARLSPQGYGRNATMFIVMKRYQINLRDYLKSNYLTPAQSLSLVTQLFSGILHLNRNNISHRDLKTDNILLNFDLDENFPTLVITDFGLCSTNLQISYLNDEICIGGNRALTAPEIITAIPGVFSQLDYSKSDEWAAGTICYELYNNCNPFYPNKEGVFLNSYSYKESELPQPMNMPKCIEQLVKQILNRNPAMRPDLEICITLCNLLMFCDELSLKCIANSRIRERELIKRINLLLSDTLFFARKKLNRLQLKLKLMFLMELDVNNVKEAIKYFEI